MPWRVLKSILILPLNAAGTIPGLILWGSRDGDYGWSVPPITALRLWLAVESAAIGMALVAATMRLFIRVGEGTPAPWDPPANLVVRGPYRYVRNPMISGMLFMLTAEALFFASIPVTTWILIFLAANMVYFPLVEEKGLEARFGADYLTHKANVPRWLPRLKSWKGQ